MWPRAERENSPHSTRCTWEAKKMETFLHLTSSYCRFIYFWTKYRKGKLPYRDSYSDWRCRFVRDVSALSERQEFVNYLQLLFHHFLISSFSCCICEIVRSKHARKTNKNKKKSTSPHVFAWCHRHSFCGSL
jgi:hypothetical protein